MQNNDRVTLYDLLPYAKIPEIYPNLYTERQWANVVTNRVKLGVDSAFCKVGHNLFVNTRKLAELMDAK